MVSTPYFRRAGSKKELTKKKEVGSLDRDIIDTEK